MQNDKRKNRFMIPVMLAVIIGTLPITGCMGHNGLTQKVKKGNLRITEHRWGREGIFVGFQVLWVYRVSILLDLLIFNSIEFWSGENPLTDQSALVNIPKEMLEKIFGNESVDLGLIQRINDREAKMFLAFSNGDRMTFDVVRTDNTYSVSYLGREFYSGTVNQTTVQ